MNSDEIVLGLTTGGHDTSYALLALDGTLLVHCEWERDIRIKEAVSDPFLYFLSDSSACEYYKFIKYVAYPFCPVTNSVYSHIFSNSSDLNLSWSKFEEYISSRNLSSPLLDQDAIKSRFFLFLSGKPQHKCFGHHQSHAAEAVFSTWDQYPEEKKIILSLDGGGWDLHDNKLIETHNSAYLCKESTLQRIWIDPSFSMGNIYGIVTSSLGFSVSPPKGSQHGSVMGLAAYGYSSVFYHLFSDDRLWCNTSIKNKQREATISALNSLRQFIVDGIKLCDSEDMLFNFKSNIAAALQDSFNSRLVQIVKMLVRLVPDIKCIVLSGGCALNCAAAGVLVQTFSSIRFPVSLIPYDAGLAIGSAYLFSNDIRTASSIFNLKRPTFSPYLGRRYTAFDQYNSLLSFGLKVHKLEVEDIIDSLYNKKIVAVFMGRSESGRRALCNRSILADPRDSSIRDILNAKVKHRPAFRPFAPVVLEDQVDEWFTHNHNSPFMSHALPFKPSKKQYVQAVVHRDGTGRLQTLNAHDNPWMYQLLTKWFLKTGIPMLINTSFNDNEPVVETPTNAIGCFLRTNIDMLVFPDIEVVAYR